MFLKVSEAQDEVPDGLGEALGRVLLSLVGAILGSWRDLDRVLGESWWVLEPTWGPGLFDPAAAQCERAARVLR
jgi:hypothetical protein